MAFDFKKEYKDLYSLKSEPTIVRVPSISYLTVRGKGDPNETDGEYQNAMGVLYAVAYTLKMSYKTDYHIEGFYEYVVPPLEGFWWQKGIEGISLPSPGSLCFVFQPSSPRRISTGRWRPQPKRRNWIAPKQNS